MLKSKLHQSLRLPVPCSQFGEGGCITVLHYTLPPKPAHVSFIPHCRTSPCNIAHKVEESLIIQKVLGAFLDPRYKVGNFTCKWLALKGFLKINSYCSMLKVTKDLKIIGKEIPGAVAILKSNKQKGPLPFSTFAPPLQRITASEMHVAT